MALNLAMRWYKKHWPQFIYIAINFRADHLQIDQSLVFVTRNMSVRHYFQEKLCMLMFMVGSNVLLLDTI